MKAYLTLLLTVLITFGCMLPGCDSSTGVAPTPAGAGEMARVNLPDWLVAPTPAGAGKYLAVVGLQTLRFYDLDSTSWTRGRYGVGVASNDMISTSSHLYVINSLSHDVSIYEMLNDSIRFVEHADIGRAHNRNPFEADFSPMRTLLITNLMDNSISEINRSNFSVMRTFPTGVAPEGIRVVDDRIYTVCTNFDFENVGPRNGFLYEHDYETGEILDTLTLRINPQYIAVDPFGRLHITSTEYVNDFSGSVQIIETDPLCVVAEIPLPGYPGRLAISSWGTVYVAAGGWSDHGNLIGIVATYDYNTLTYNQTISVGLGATDIVVDEANQAVFVACGEAGTLDEIRADTVYAHYEMDDPPQVVHIWALE